MDKQLVWGKQDVTFNNNDVFEGKGSHYYILRKIVFQFLILRMRIT